MPWFHLMGNSIIGLEAESNSSCDWTRGLHNVARTRLASLTSLVEEILFELDSL